MNKFFGNKKQVVFGATLSYVLIIINTIYGLAIFPYILSKLGQSEYGVYKTIASFTGTLAIMDLGIGSTLQRFISKFSAQGEEKRIDNYIAMMFIQLLIMIIGISIVSFILYLYLPSFFNSSFSSSELVKAKNLYILLIISLIFSVISNFLIGIITGFNRFIFVNSINIINVAIKILLTILILLFYANSVVLVFIDIGLTISIIIIQLIYISRKLKVHIKIIKFDKLLFKESFIYMSFMFLSALINQANNNLDNVIVGAILGSSFVAIYSFALVLENVLEKFACAISKVILPTIVNQIERGDSIDELENTVVKIGRIQFILCGAIVSGFIVLGKRFIILWLGNKYLDIWLIALIIMLPRSIELIENTYLAVLRAKNKIGFRTVGLFLMTILNLIITILGTKKWGYIAAASGTSISIFIFELIIMNIYYSTKLHLNPIKTLLRIIDKTFLAVLVTSIIIYLLKSLFSITWGSLILLILIYVCVYFVLLLLYGFSEFERDSVKRVVYKLLGRKKK